MQADLHSFPDFAALNAYLEQLGLFRMTPGLERMRAMLERLGLIRPPFAVVQVVGTNGKGSTSTMLESLARTHGLKTGLHASPHFLSVRERVRVNGEMLSGPAWAALGGTLLRNGGKELSYFEFVTCLAVLAFAEAGVDVAVMETGLGGSFDATTALEADMVVFTPFALDHQAVLGLTLEQIAEDKAGAVRQGRPVVSAPQRPEARRQIVRAADAKGAVLIELPPLQTLKTGLPEDVRVESLPKENADQLRSAGIPCPGLAGAHQRENARLALAAWNTLLHGAEEAQFPGPDARKTIAEARASKGAWDMEKQALENSWLPGRMQAVPAFQPGPGDFRPCELGWPPLLLDGAHNSHGLAALGLSLARAGIAPLAVIFACLADKDLKEIVPHLRALATGLIVVPPIADNPRAMPPVELAAQIGLNALAADSLANAFIIAAEHMAGRMPEVFAPEPRPTAARNPLLICGSLYLLGEFYALRPDCLLKQSSPERFLR